MSTMRVKRRKKRRSRVATNKKKVEILIGIYERRLERLKVNFDLCWDVKGYAIGQLEEIIKDLKVLCQVIK